MNIQVGDTVKRFNGDTFSSGKFTDTVSGIECDNGFIRIWLEESRSWCTPKYVVVVETKEAEPNFKINDCQSEILNTLNQQLEKAKKEVERIENAILVIGNLEYID